MRRAVRRAVLLALIVTLTAVGCTSGNDATVYGGSFQFTSPGGLKEYSYPAAERKKLDELSGPDLSGKNTISLSQFAGKVVVVNFWGSWCPPCRDEASELQRAWQSWNSRGVQFLGVDVRDEPGAGTAFNASKQISYPSIFDPSLRTLLSIRGYPVDAIPSTVVLDKQHRVAHIWLHEINAGNINDVVTALAAER